MHVNWKDPSAALALLPTLALAGGALTAELVWPRLAVDLTGQTQYWFMRAAPVLLFIPPALAGLCVVALLPRHKRMPVALVTMLLVLGVALAYAWREYERLSPFADEGMGFNELSRYLDALVIVGAVIGVMVAGLGARLATYVPEKVRRVKGGMIGDADWMDIGNPRQLTGHVGPLPGFMLFQSSQGLIMKTPTPTKSTVFRVTSVIP